MAYAALVSLEQVTEMFLNHDGLHEYFFAEDVRGFIKSIRGHVNLLLSFLEQHPEKANRFEAKIRDSAREAEDHIEYFMWHRRQMNFFSFLIFFAFRGWGFGWKLIRVTNDISSAYGDVINDRSSDSAAEISSARAVSTRNNDVVIGLDADLLELKGRLCGVSSKLEVIPIVGMGGIGKTTLAQKAYDDPLIIERFHIRLFVQVSQDYRAKEFLSNLLSSIRLSEEQMITERNDFGVSEDVYDESRIAEYVYQCLKGRRYLIVLDDIWNTNVWDDVRRIFPDDKNGSRIMLTTRLSHVAAYVCPRSPLHEMKFLDENHSWNLLKRRVFRHGQGCPPELEDIGKEIAVGCRGLPLAVVLVVGILSAIARTRASWEKISRDMNPLVDGQLDRILSSSYRHLPHHLRLCFLFMGSFPEDHSIQASRLIKLWVAEGFLKRKSFEEEEAEKYLEDLVKRSLVLVTGRKTNGKIKTCRLHDLVREMCIRTAQEEKFLLTDRYAIPHQRKNERRISIGHSRVNGICLCSNYGISTHTLLCFRVPKPSFLAFVVGFHLLRVLDIIASNIEELVPFQLFKLIHLKYLAVSFAFQIPAAISNLVNLQTLIIAPRKRAIDHENPPSSSYLPLEILMMPRLRHLVFPNFYILPDLANGSVLPLQNLLTLSVIASFGCSKKIVEVFPNLKKLGLVYFEKEEHQPCLQHLAHLQQLEKLKIKTYPDFSLEGQIYSAFPRSLKKLVLVGGGLPWSNMTIVGSLPNLEVLKLMSHACVGDTWETSQGEFSQLKYLRIRISNLQHWISEKDHFPRLEKLVVTHCPHLSGIPDGIGEISTLDWIFVDNLNQSLENSARQILQAQREYGNDNCRGFIRRRN